MRNSKARKRAKTLNDFPALIEEINFALNGDVKPKNIGEKSQKRLWWKCKKGHEWDQPVYVRTDPKHTGCPFCSGKRLSKDYNFAALFPSQAKEWHPTKNGKKKPAEYFPKANKKVWWQCSNGHSYDMLVSERAAGKNCPICSGKRVTDENSLERKLPKIAKEWHMSKNGALTPSKVTASSGKKVWWICNKGHEYQAYVYQRKAGSGCPYCSGRYATFTSSISTTHPELLKEWHPVKNKNLSPTKYRAGSGKLIWWLCPNGHEWNASINSRAGQGTGCPKCSRQTSAPDLRLYSEIQSIWKEAKLREKIDGYEVDLAITSLKIGIEYDGSFFHKTREATDKRKTMELQKRGWEVIRIREYPLGKTDASDILIKGQLSKKDMNQLVNVLLSFEKSSEINKFAEKYLLRTEFAAEEKYREYLSFYPRPIPEKALPKTHPEISKEWHIERNYPVEPAQFTYGSHYKAWWICRCGYEWQTTIAHRAMENTGCPKCAGKVATNNYNAANNPRLRKEFSKELNPTIKLEELLPSSHKKLWWQCSSGHQWQTSVAKRSAGQNCPECSGKKVGKDNNLQILFPKIAEEWHPIKNGQLKPMAVTAGSSKKVWWICKKGHNYEKTVVLRTTRNQHCPECKIEELRQTRSVAALFKELLSEWDYSKNQETDPEITPAKSHLKVWWRCVEGHEWKASISNRTNVGANCPYCSGNLATEENNFAKLHPDLLKEWDWEKNTQFNPHKLKPGSGKKVWWTCPNGHSYEKAIEQRAKRSRGCSLCRKIK